MHVVDGLVRSTLDERKGRRSSGDQLDAPDDAAASDEKYRKELVAATKDDDDDEAQKYSNRAALLENVLRANTKQLKIMTNRAKLLENTLKQLQIKWRKEQEESGRVREEQKRMVMAQIANLTAIIEASARERDTMIQTFEKLRIDMESDHNATIIYLEAKVTSMEQELARLNDDERARVELQTTEERKSYREEELEEKVRQQQLTIQELQMKLADV